MNLDKSVRSFKRYINMLELIKDINSPSIYALVRKLNRKIVSCKPDTSRMEDIIAVCDKYDVNPVTYIKFVMP